MRHLLWILLGVSGAGILARLARYRPSPRKEGESLRAFRVRQIDRVMLRAEVWDHEDERERAA